MATMKSPAPSTMTWDAASTWEDAYRAAAKQDRHGLLAERLEELIGDPELAPEVVENTIWLVALVCACYYVDGRDGIEGFLRLQTYDFSDSEAKYLLRFEPAGVGFLLVNDMSQVSLGDIFDAPPGFRHIYIERVDGKPLSGREGLRLKKAIRDDFYSDYGRDEVSLSFETSSHAIVLTAFEVDEDE